MSHSETSGPFIAYFLEKLGASIDYDDHRPIKTLTDIDRSSYRNQSGLYVFYMKNNTGSQIRYPIYVGVTGRSFYRRFYEHATTSTGQIKKVWDGVYPENVYGYELYIWTLDVTHVAAKYLESVLLEVWDFPLNQSENGDERSYLDTSAQRQPEDDKHDFDISWGNYFKEIQNINHEYVD
jgi:hypothetical protein